MMENAFTCKDLHAFMIRLLRCMMMMMMTGFHYFSYTFFFHPKCFKTVMQVEDAMHLQQLSSNAKEL